MIDIQAGLTRWGLDLGQVRERVYRAPTPRERERWHALWLVAQGWSANEAAALLEREAHTVGQWLAAFCSDGPEALTFEQSGGSPPPSRPRCRPRRRRWASTWRVGTGKWCGSSSPIAAACG